MNKRYIDIDSGFRDRKLWPNPAEFGIQLAQTGNKIGILNAKNPISLAYPYYQWQWGCRLVGTSSTGDGEGLLLGGSLLTDPPSNVAIIFPRGGAGTYLQPMPFDFPITLGALLINQTLSLQITRNTNFFNGLLLQCQAPALGAGTNADYSTSRIISYKANTNILNNAGNAYSGIFTVESGLTAVGSWSSGARLRIENNLNALATAGTWTGPEVFIPGGVNADGVYVGDIYEAILYTASGGIGPGGVVHQFRTIIAYDGTRRVATLDNPLILWTSPANDITAPAAASAGATYLHRIRRSLPLLPLDGGGPPLTPNMPLTLTGNILNAIYSVEIVNPGAGYGIGQGTITAILPAILNILSVTPAGGVTSVSIAIPGQTLDAGFTIGQVLPLTPPPIPANPCTIRVTGVGFGVNVFNAVGIGVTATNFTNQIFYVPALNQPLNTPTGSALDPSAAQQFIPQNNAVVSFTGNSYSNDSTASSIIRGDFFNVAPPSHFLVIESFQNAFPPSGREFNILPYDEDHVVPMNYTGSTVSQGQMVCYQMTLESITIPNVTITALGLGGLIAFYPYIYVEFRNASAACGQGNTPTLYSNNPASNKALWKCSITDTPTPLISRFIKIRADGMQTVKFKPNDNLYFKIVLPNGQTFETNTKDTAPPLLPNLLLQISFSVGIERL